MVRASSLERGILSQNQAGRRTSKLDVARAAVPALVLRKFFSRRVS